MAATTMDIVKLSIPITTNAYDAEISDLIDAAVLDLQTVGISNAGNHETDPLLRRAVVTYVRMHFGAPANYDRLLASYEAQKGQLQMSSDYGGADDGV